MFHQLNIRGKLAFALGGAVLLAFLLAGAVLALYQSLTLTDRAREIMEPYAQLVSTGTEAAIAFEDPVRAQEILNTLGANPQILEGAIYLEDGRLLARFSRLPGTRAMPLPSRSEGVYLRADRVELLQNLPHGAQLHLVMGLGQVHEQTRESLWMFGAIALMLLFITLGQLMVLQRTIVKPIAALTEATERVRAKADYDFGVPASGDDEVARLGVSFNAMIEAVQAREHDLRQLALFQHALLDSAAYGIISTDPDGLITSYNPAAERLLGYTAAEVVGKQTPELWHDKEEMARRAQQLSETFGEAVEPGFAVFRVRALHDLPDESEWTFIRKDGTRVPVLLSVTALRDESGQLVGLVGLVNDLTERKRFERELELLKTAVNASSEAAFLTNEAGRFVYVNDMACKSLGYTRDELLGLTPLDIDPDMTPEGFDRLRRDTLTVGPIETQEARQRTCDGRIFPVELSGSVIEHDGSKFRLSVARDITERKNAEEQIRKLSQAVEQSPSSIVITDLEPNIIYVNRTFTENTGYAPDEVIGKNPRILKSGKTSKQVYDDLWAHLVKGETWRGEFINRRKNGSEYFESVMISPVRDVNGKITNYLAIKDDITEKKLAAEREIYLAHFDQLTGLPNRTLLQDHFKYALSMAERSVENLAIVFLDLDHFKDINDTLGHSVGDRLLVEMARRLKSAMREADTVSRMGGDEFIFILPKTDENGAAHLVKKLIEVVSAPCQIEQHQLIVTPSIGIAIYPEDGTDMEVLSQNADAAMYQAKQAGRNGYRFFTQAMQIQSARHLQLANELRQAITRNQLQLNYQPQISVQDGHLVGVEALLRWHHPELGTISPAEFIPIAEDTGLIIPIGEWVLRTALMQMKIWLERGFVSMTMAVNLSAVQFRQANLPDTVSGILAEVGLSPEYLELELTEAVAMDDPQAATAMMDSLHERGIRLSIDDFGTGYSSLSYLKRFRVSKLKIDQSFVRDITDDPEDKAIVVAIINLASGLGMHTVAEGVETAAQLAFLRLQGCDEVQGYYFSKALTSDDFETFVRQMR